jgi:O-antigen biosynthesis protein
VSGDVEGAFYAQATRWTERPDLIRLLDDHAVHPGRVLDVGCGSGLFGQALLRRGAAEVWGVEVGAERADAAGGRLSRVVCAAFPTTQLVGERFDLVVLADVLEHLPDPWDALAVCRQMLAPGGTVLLSVPNVSHYTVAWPLLLGRWQYVDAGLLDRTHLRFFTPGSLAGALSQAGLEVVVWRDKALARPRRYRALEALLRLVAPHQLSWQMLVLARDSGDGP